MGRAPIAAVLTAEIVPSTKAFIVGEPADQPRNHPLPQMGSTTRADAEKKSIVSLRREVPGWTNTHMSALHMAKMRYGDVNDEGVAKKPRTRLDKKMAFALIGNNKDNKDARETAVLMSENSVGALSPPILDGRGMGAALLVLPT
jgi:hypothetical protein